MFFSGKSVSTRRVDLRGNSKSQESRDQILERARNERLLRQENRRRIQSAILIQACWRGRSISSKCLEEARKAWLQEFGNRPADASWFCDPSSHYVRAFLFFAHSGECFSWRRDGAVLVEVCRAATHTMTATGELAFIVPAASADFKPTIVFRAQRLVRWCLHSLHINRVSSTGPSGSFTEDAAVVLTEFSLKFAAPDTWKPVLPREASQVVWKILAHAAQHHMFDQLASMLCTCSSPDAAPKSKKGSIEALVSQLVIRYLSVSPPNAASSHASLHPLLCVPNLWRRCPALSPIAGRIVANCIMLCGQLEASQLTAQLPEDVGPGGKTASAVALLGNIIAGASKALVSDKTPEGSRTLHIRLATLLQTLVSLIPMHVFLPSSPLASSDLAPPLIPAPRAAITPLHWDEEVMVPRELAQQVELLYSSDGILVLQKLAGAMLPYTTLQPKSGVVLEEVTEGVQGLCQLLSHLLTHSAAPQELLLRLGVSCSLIQRLWFSFLRPMVENYGMHGQGPKHGSSEEAWWMLPLSVMCPVFHAWLQTADLEEFHRQQQPLPHSQLHTQGQGQWGVIGVLKSALWQLLWMEFDKTLSPPNPVRVSCCRSAGQLLQLLFDLNSRRPFVAYQAFHAEQLAAERFTTEALTSARNTPGAEQDVGPLKTQLGATSSRSWALLHYAPCLVPFLERARLFQEIVSEDRDYHLEMERRSQQDALVRGMDIDSSQRFITIRRDQLLTDGFDHLDKLGEKLKGRIRIQFINEHGVPEAGVDGGGLFKDFMEDLIQQGFNPEYGVFKTTPHQQLYPNPAAYQVLQDAPRMLEFMGRMLGKAVYEGILSELPFAGFFLKRFRGSYCSLSDLPSLDPEVYRSLNVLRHYKGDLSELCLTFSATIDAFGKQTEVELKPGGKDIPVTSDNVIEYIHRMADFRLNKQMHAASSAFLRGFFDIINPAWVRMFNEEEIQMLISGSDATADQLETMPDPGGYGEVVQQLPVRGLDLQDMQAYTNYAGGYHEDHPVIISFWKALASMTPREQRAILKFVTSSSRGPLLGFKYLEPPLCIQMAGHMLDPSATERLPTSATCMNLLKLPPYSTAEEMRKKLLMSSQLGQGFHLS